MKPPQTVAAAKMTPVTQASAFPCGARREVVSAAALWLTLFLVLWGWVDVGLIYHGGGGVASYPTFSWDARYATDVLRYPGGVVDYVAAFMMQSTFYSGLGGLVLALQMTVLYVGLRGCLRCAGAVQGLAFAVVPPLWLLAIYSHYLHCSSQVAGLTLSVVSAWLWLTFRPAKAAVEVFLGCAVILAFGVLDPVGLIPFVAILAVADLMDRVHRPWLILKIATALAVPFILARVYGFGIDEVTPEFLPVPWHKESAKRMADLLIWGAFVSTVMVFAGVVGWAVTARWRAVSLKAQPKEAASKHSTHPVGSGIHPKNAARHELAWLWEPVALSVGVLLVTALMHHGDVKLVLKADRLAWEGRWAQLLECTGGTTVNSPYLGCAIAQAMYHQGRLSQELPPLRDPDDLLLTKDNLIGQWRKSDLYLDLGFVNRGMHYLTESVERWGERPLLLQRLAQVNLALGNVATARIYLEALLRVPFQHRWATQELAALESGIEDPEVTRLRALDFKRDSVVKLSPDEELLGLLAANRSNRMAYEYLMTHYLLLKDLRNFTRNIGRISDFPDLKLSPLWEEALVLEAARAGRTSDALGHPINPETRRRLERVIEIVRQLGNGPETVNRLREEHGQSYFSYYFVER